MNNDAISRQAVQDFIGVMKACNDISDGAYQELMVYFENLPPVDAVLVVRCKDCKYWRDTDHTCHEHSLVSPMTADEFCSRGERKGSEHHD